MALEFAARFTQVIQLRTTPQALQGARLFLWLRSGWRHRRGQAPCALSCEKASAVQAGEDGANLLVCGAAHDFHTKDEQSFCIFAVRGLLPVNSELVGLWAVDNIPCHRSWRQAGATWLPSLRTWQLRRSSSAKSKKQKNILDAAMSNMRVFPRSASTAAWAA